LIHHGDFYTILALFKKNQNGDSKILRFSKLPILKILGIGAWVSRID
jgi:hypothetical protein